MNNPPEFIPNYHSVCQTLFIATSADSTVNLRVQKCQACVLECVIVLPHVVHEVLINVSDATRARASMHVAGFVRARLGHA